MFELNASTRSNSERPSIPPGTLDGVTVMRYAHIYRDRTSGGVEQYLRNVNQGLLQRHRMTIIQMHLLGDARHNQIETQRVGLGQILWVPVGFLQTASIVADLPRRMRYVYRHAIEELEGDSKRSLRRRLLAVYGLLCHKSGYLRHNAVILSRHLSDLLITHKVSVLTLHWLTYDADALISSAVRAGIPYLLINHFDNTWFNRVQTRKWLPTAAGIGAVSSLRLPTDVQGRAINLSDAIDTEFFNPKRARPLLTSAIPMILLPARIALGKGHLDLLKAGQILRSRNIGFHMWFAGAVECERLRRQLQEFARSVHLDRHVVFLGEVSPEELRDCYGTSSVVVLSSHSEGLGRVLLEAQAMQKPVVAYECGGVGEAVADGETGFLVKRGDVKALADKLTLLLNDEGERRRLTRACREFVTRKFSVSALLDRHESFILESLRHDADANYPTARVKQS